MLGLVAPGVSQCPLLFEKHILYAKPATRLPSEVQAASARPNYNSIATYLHGNQKLLHVINFAKKTTRKKKRKKPETQKKKSVRKKGPPLVSTRNKEPLNAPVLRKTDKPSYHADKKDDR